MGENVEALAGLVYWIIMGFLIFVVAMIGISFLLGIILMI